MLRGLSVKDILIIDRLDVDFQPGLNVLTGETGAGKSILLDCLGFVLGWRGRAELVRQGAKQGEVTAWFDVRQNHPVIAILAEAGIEIEDELVLRRTNAQDGRKTSYINDRRCSGDLLRRVGDTLIELHGQHDDKGLLNVNSHRDLLDAYAQNQPELAACKETWNNLRHAQKTFEAQSERMAAAKAEEDYLRHALKEVGDLAPKQGEEAELDTKRRLMQSAEKIRDDIHRALQIMGPDAAEGNLGDAVRWLETADDKLVGSDLAAALSGLTRAISELGEAQQMVERFADSLNFNPSELEMVEERLFALRALARKHEILPDELPDLFEKLTQKVAELDNSGTSMAQLEQKVKDCANAFDAAAKKLSQTREAAGKALDTSMSKELAPLKMERAVFQTTMEAGSAGPNGIDMVSFRVATNPGAPSGPLNKIASGGELSRFLLALKVCLTGQNSGLTLIFDEIDRGVGGATADAVGRRLAELGQDGQVLVVTHSPQVAALGNAHWRVEKSVVDEVTLSTVVPLSETERVSEIARMLSGDRVTPEAKAAAKALMSA